MERESYPPPSSPINMQGEAIALITLTQKLTLRATALQTSQIKVQWTRKIKITAWRCHDLNCNHAHLDDSPVLALWPCSPEGGQERMICIKTKCQLLIYIYTLLHKLARNITSYCTSGRGNFMSRRGVKMQPMSTMVAICMLTLWARCAQSKRPIVGRTNTRTLVSGKQKVFCISILCQFVDLLVYYLQSKDPKMNLLRYRFVILQANKISVRKVQISDDTINFRTLLIQKLESNVSYQIR